MKAPTILIVTIVVLVLVVMFLVLLLVNALRQTPDLPPDPPTADLAMFDVLMAIVKDQQSYQHELAMKLAEALAGMAAPAPVESLPEPPAADADPTYTIDDIPWDPTDADDSLGHDTYRDVALVRAPVFDNSAPDLITHPLGIPGLSLPYAPLMTAGDEINPPDLRGFAPPARFDVV